MAEGRLIDQPRFEAMLAAYREKPGNFRQCSLSTDIDHRTCKRAWLKGWPERGMRPIQDIIAEEQQKARAKLQQEREAALRATAAEEADQAKASHQAAQRDAVESRTQEAQMVRAARHNTMGLMAVVQRTLVGANKLAEKVQEALAKQQPGTEGSISLGKATALFHQIASMTRAANESARLAQQMERSLLGEPDQWVGLQVDHLTQEQAFREVELAHKAIQRARRRGIIPAVDTEGESTGGGIEQDVGSAPGSAGVPSEQQQAQGAEAHGVGAPAPPPASSPSVGGQQPPAPPAPATPGAAGKRNGRTLH